MLSFLKKKEPIIERVFYNTPLIDALNWLQSVGGNIRFDECSYKKEVIVSIYTSDKEFIYIPKQINEDDEPCAALIDAIWAAQKTMTMDNTTRGEMVITPL